VAAALKLGFLASRKGTSFRAIVEACVGKGRLFLYGPEVNQRAQSHAAFGFLFNGLYYGPASSRTGTCPVAR
jgi:hypothetical protein